MQGMDAETTWCVGLIARCQVSCTISFIRLHDSSKSRDLLLPPAHLFGPMQVERKLCVDARNYCLSKLSVPPMIESGVNPYDMRKNCGAGLTQEQLMNCVDPSMNWMQKFMNLPETRKKVLSVYESRELCFGICLFAHDFARFLGISPLIHQLNIPDGVKAWAPVNYEVNAGLAADWMQRSDQKVPIYGSKKRDRQRERELIGR